MSKANNGGNHMVDTNKNLGMCRVFENLKARGDIVIIEKEVDPVCELSGIIVALNSLERTPPVIFRNVKGFEFQVGANFFTDRYRICETLNLPQDSIKFKEKYLHSIDNPVEPLIIKDGACQEVVLTSGFDVSKLIPNIQAGLDDGGRYFQPTVITKDPPTGIRNMGMYRAMIAGKDKLAVNIRKEAHIGLHFDRAKKANIPFPVAIVMGGHPDIYISACTKLPAFRDELALVGALRNSPVELVKCKTIDLEVPASASVVIEGEIQPPYEETREGPWPEYLKYMSLPAMRPVMQVKAITYRRDKFSYAVVAGTKEIYGLRISNNPMFYGFVKKLYPDFVIDAILTPGSANWHHAVIKVNKNHYELEGMQYNAALAAFGFSMYVDTIIMVDEDIDIYNINEVEWAICTRCNPKDQIHILPEGRGHRISPIIGVQDLMETPKLTKAKMIIDATVPFHYKEKERAGIKLFERARFKQVDLKDYLSSEDIKKWIR